MRKVTQKDIAEAAGVSQALVSMVLNWGGESNRIPAGRRRQILTVAEKLGYRPRKKRRVKGRDKLFVFVSTPLGAYPRSGWLNHSVQSFYARLYEQVHLAALRKGYSTMHYPAERIEELTQWLSEWEVSGIFWNNSSLALLDWVAPRFPVVQLERRLRRDIDACMADQEITIHLAVEHLHAQGHRKIGYISKSPADDFLAQSRFFALGIASEQLGVEVVKFRNGDAVLADLKKKYPVTGLIAPDLVCFGVIQDLTSQGYNCPEDLSIVGIDNYDACDFSNPALTSVDLNFRDTAESAVDLLLARMDGADYEARSIALLPSLVERGSVRSLFQERLIPSLSSTSTIQKLSTL